MSLVDYLRLDASEYGISKRVPIFKNDKGDLAFIISRKSRFVMKDAKKLVERAELISRYYNKRPHLIISTPLCSKAEKFLSENKIEIEKI